MLNQEAVLLLRRTADLGVVAPKQTDDLLHACWTRQERTCPVCAEEVPWHRGLVFQNGHQVAWICMVCALLEIQEFKMTLPERSRPSKERQVPLPPDHVIAWLKTEWIHQNEKASAPSALDVARMIGREATDRIWAAIIEDPKAARLSRPKGELWKSREWTPFVLHKGPHRFDRATQLLTYIGSQEEITTTDFIHHDLGIKSSDYSTHIQNTEDRGEIELCKIPDAIMAKIPDMSAESRRNMIPRLGLIDRNLWESQNRTDAFSIQSLARTAEYPGGMLLYLIPFGSCGYFYFTRNDPEWMSHMGEYCDEVGFDFAEVTDEGAATSQSLWQRIFGDLLIPD